MREAKGTGAVPVEAQYTVVLRQPSDDLRVGLPGPEAARTIRGVVTLAGTRESIAGAAFRRAATILVRESGF